MRTLAILVILLPGFANAAEVDFAHEIVPLLKEQCGKCHSGSQMKGGYSINSRESLLNGGESGAAVVISSSKESELIQRISSQDDAFRMPPEGKPLTAEQVQLVARWIDEGVKWEAGFSFGPRIYEPPLKPHMPELPPPTAGRTNPIDRILDAYLVEKKQKAASPVGDATFLRRVSLHLIGLLPTPEERDAFLKDASPDKRERLVRTLLDSDVEYAEHWLTFWNDLLRNDYTGTGFITGGRKQISKWLYDALANNKPYDQFVRELIAPPTPESAGFADGIRWRGEVSAGQTVEIQFAQSVGQAFLGINLKCASCHDSFIDRWTLEDSYGLAAIYAQRPLELHRCDKPTGKMATAAWLFDELGQVDANAHQPERLKQLAALLTHRENGRFARTIVNRFWYQLMGRGIVHPPDAMQSQPWNADLLDFLAADLIKNNYDLKKTLELIATSQAYQSQVEVVSDHQDAQGYQYAGPRSKRMTAEQFIDCLWQITDTAPQKFDAPVIRGKSDPQSTTDLPVAGSWIWNRADSGSAAAGETIAFRKEWELKEVPAQATAVISCDNEYTFYLNGKQLQAGANWEAPDLVILKGLKPGQNEILLIGKNGGGSPNPAGLFFEARWNNSQGETERITSDESWQWSAQLPERGGKYQKQPEDWQPAAKSSLQQVWMSRLAGELANLLSRGNSGSQNMVRASLVKSDFLMRSLGRPNRDQIVTVRPQELTTLEAIDLENGEALASHLRQGAAQLLARNWNSPEEMINWLFEFSLGRKPTSGELALLKESIGPELDTAEVEDILWSIVMLPEFQIVR